MDFEKSQATLKLEAEVEPKVRKLLQEDLETWQQNKLKQQIFILLRDNFLYGHALQKSINDGSLQGPKKEQWDPIAATKALQYAMEQCRKGARNEATGEPYTFVGSFKFKYKLIFNEEITVRLKEKNGRESSELCLRALRDFFRLLMKARDWENEKIKKCLRRNLLDYKKAVELLEELGADEKEEQEFKNIFDNTPGSVSLDAENEDGEGETSQVLEKITYESYQQQEGARFSSDVLVMIIGKAMEIAAARKRGNSEQLLRYWVTVQLCSGEMAAETVQELKQYEDTTLRDYLKTCPKGKGKMALREALAVYMHKAPETVRKDLEVSVTNSSSKVQKLLFQAATELKREGKL